MKTENEFPALLQAFFTDRLCHQRQASRHTIASYRDTFRLLLAFAERRLKKAPSALTITDLDTPFLGAFLDHLEQERGNAARSRNVRLAALHSFFRYVALHKPEVSALAQRVLALPSKRYHRTQIHFLTRREIEALLAVPDQNTWAGRRDRTGSGLTEARNGDHPAACSAPALLRRAAQVRTSRPRALVIPTNAAAAPPRPRPG